MTYRSLKTFIKNNTQENNAKFFDLISKGIKSKIILVVGDGASNTASYLSSIMLSCDISHFHYTNNKNTDVNKRFLQNGEPILQEILCENAENIIKNSQKFLSNDDLLFALAVSISNEEYAIIEISEEYYSYIKNHFSLFALILAIKNDDKAFEIIKNAPCGIKEIISLSQKDDFDYISTKTNQNGTRITLASPNKITVFNSDLFGTSFYHYSYQYHISSLNLNNVSLANLAIESASVIFGAPRPYIYKGIESARLPNDLLLYSLLPTILLYEGDNDFKLHHKLKFVIKTEKDVFVYPSENTVFCGNKEYIEQIKEKLKKR